MQCNLTQWHCHDQFSAHHQQAVLRATGRSRSRSMGCTRVASSLEEPAACLRQDHENRQAPPALERPRYYSTKWPSTYPSSRTGNSPPLEHLHQLIQSTTGNRQSTTAPLRPRNANFTRFRPPHRVSMLARQGSLNMLITEDSGIGEVMRLTRLGTPRSAEKERHDINRWSHHGVGSFTSTRYFAPIASVSIQALGGCRNAASLSM